MKKFISVFLTAVILVCMCAPCLAVSEGGTVYYFDSASGSDENDGKSPDAAFSTLNKLNEIHAKPGDEFLFRAGGIFTGNCTPKGSGTSDSPILFSSYGDAEKDGKPLFIGSSLVPVFTFINSSFITVENLEITSPEGGGIAIIAYESVATDFTVRNCVMHNISDTAGDKKKICSPVYICSMGLDGRLDNITLADLTVYDSAYGVQMSGADIETNSAFFVSPEESYNRNILIEDSTFSDILYDGVIFSSVNGGNLRNCLFSDCCLLSDSYTAPVWMHHSNAVTVEKSEISGTQNTKDGMTVDFDGWTTNSTYQYIYSHDNTRFIKNCCFDGLTSNSGNTVRYCLSVNDNRRTNYMAVSLLSDSYGYSLLSLPKGMKNFSFYNNTLVNCSRVSFIGVRDSVIANNIFSGKFSSCLGIDIPSKPGRWLSSSVGTVTNNCFYGMLPFVKSADSLFCNPGFNGGDELEPSSYILCKDSRLIGAGIQVSEDMGETDFYGNTLTDIHNIGCYEGSGSENTCGGNAFC